MLFLITEVFQWVQSRELPCCRINVILSTGITSAAIPNCTPPSMAFKGNSQYSSCSESVLVLYKTKTLLASWSSANLLQSASFSYNHTVHSAGFCIVFQIISPNRLLWLIFPLKNPKKQKKKIPKPNCFLSQGLHWSYISKCTFLPPPQQKLFFWLWSEALVLFSISWETFCCAGKVMQINEEFKVQFC